MITRRILAVLLVAMLSLTLFPAVAPAHAATTTINYFTFSAAPDHVKDLDTIIAAFKQENPDIDVKVQTAPFADYFTLLQTDLSGVTGPDVFELNYENFVTYASKSTLLDISSPASADKTWDA